MSDDDEKKAAEQARVVAAIRRAFAEIGAALKAEMTRADVYDALLSLTIEAEARASFLGSTLILVVGPELAPDLDAAARATRRYAAGEACRRITDLPGAIRVH